VGNGHLNQYGHQIIAEKLAETIQAEQQGKRDSEEQQ
jgi:lysophospholipase L1-like esterase